MGEAKKPAAMIEIHPGSPEWQAWLKHHCGTKTEMRMLACLGRKTKIGDVIPPRPWLERSKFPPDAPKPEGVTRRVAQVAPSSLQLDRRSVPGSTLDEVADRLIAADERRLAAAKTKKRRQKEADHAEAVLDDALGAVRGGQRPHVNGGDHLGTLNVVDVDKHGRPGIFAKVTNLRDDPVGQMHKRKQLGEISDDGSGLGDVRLRAARRWQVDYERAEIHGARAIPIRERTDGGKVDLGVTDEQMRAQKMLGHIRRELGAIGDRLATWVLGEKLSLADVALRLGKVAPMDQKVLGHRFRECLDTIAAAYGLAHDNMGAIGPRPRPRDAFDEAARYAWSPELHRATLAAKSRP